MKRFVFASDSFKGSLSSGQIASILEEEAKRFFPDCECIGLCVGDGGEGTLDVVLREESASPVEVEVADPLGRPVIAAYAVLDRKKAVIEMAAASGLPLLKPEERDPLQASSYGTGQMIRDALERGCREITVAIGGSATNDGGIGAMTALGVRFLDETGKVLEGRGKDLMRIDKIDISSLCPLVSEAEFTVMCDVNNPLTGHDGATFTFGPQKGGTKESLSELEKGMLHYEELLKRGFGESACETIGAGAAGGLGAALSVFLKAGMKPGIEVVLDLIEFDKKAEYADLVVTGEGRIDWQSSYGKVPGGIGEHCRRLGVPAVAIVGGVGPGAELIYDHGIRCIIPTVDGVMELNEAMERAEELYRRAAGRLFSLVRIGIELK